MNITDYRQPRVCSCGKRILEKRSDGKTFESCCKCRKKGMGQRERTDVSNPLRMDDIIPCRRCLWTGTVREMAYSHRAENEW